MSLDSRSAIVVQLRAAGCVFAEDEADLLIAAAGEEPTRSDLASMVRQRVSGRPLEYILGWAEFCGVRMVVEPGVFVPRHRSEFMVERALLAAAGSADLLVLDMCCGAGAIGAAVAAGLDGPRLFATDVDPAAVRCARINLPGGTVFEGDLFAPLPEHLQGRVQILLANAPYVPTDAIALMPPEARLHEERAALDGGPDGLDVQRRVIAAAPHWLAPTGVLLVETSDRQGPLTLELATRAGLDARIVTDDDRDATVVLATPVRETSATGVPR